jgi:hypothetical protein
MAVVHGLEMNELVDRPTLNLVFGAVHNPRTHAERTVRRWLMQVLQPEVYQQVWKIDGDATEACAETCALQPAA